MKKTTIIKTAAAVLAASLTTSIAGITASARTLVLSGDYDMDCAITSSDAHAALRLSTIPESRSNVIMNRMDINRDGDITSFDAVRILRVSADIESFHQAEQERDPYTVNNGLNDFSAQLFKRTYEPGENTLVSPLSVYTALAMLQNGAKGKTQQELVDLLGGGSNSALDINLYLSTYLSALRDGKFLNIANSVFFMDREDLHIGEDFTETVKRDYFAEIFKEPANKATVDKINGWCYENTHGMIEKIVSEDTVNNDTAALLLNAVAFEAEWVDTFDTESGVFHNYSGTNTTCEFLRSDEEYRYISDELSEGVIKPYNTSYKDEETGEWLSKESYALLAILPNKGVSVDDYIAQMNDSTLRQLVETYTTDTSITMAMPKFSYDCSFDLTETLPEMGIASAFAPGAEFDPLAKCDNGNGIHVGSVLHKTFIDLDERGTRAAAVTAIDMDIEAAIPNPEKELIFDRPFVYVIYDMNNKVPVFIGALCEM